MCISQDRAEVEICQHHWLVLPRISIIRPPFRFLKVRSMQLAEPTRGSQLVPKAMRLPDWLRRGAIHLLVVAQDRRQAHMSDRAWCPMSSAKAGSAISTSGVAISERTQVCYLTSPIQSSWKFLAYRDVWSLPCIFSHARRALELRSIQASLNSKQPKPKRQN